MSRLDPVVCAVWAGCLIWSVLFWAWVGWLLWPTIAGALDAAGFLSGCEAFAAERVACAEGL